MKTTKTTEGTGRAVQLIPVRPRTQAQRDCLVEAAKAAGVSASYYLLESALMVAAEEGHTPASTAPPPKWVPKLIRRKRRPVTRA